MFVMFVFKRKFFDFKLILFLLFFVFLLFSTVIFFTNSSTNTSFSPVHEKTSNLNKKRQSNLAKLKTLYHALKNESNQETLRNIKALRTKTILIDKKIYDIRNLKTFNLSNLPLFARLNIRIKTELKILVRNNVSFTVLQATVQNKKNTWNKNWKQRRKPKKYSCQLTRVRFPGRRAHLLKRGKTLLSKLNLPINRALLLKIKDLTTDKINDDLTLEKRLTILRLIKL